MQKLKKIALATALLSVFGSGLAVADVSAADVAASAGLGDVTNLYPPVQKKFYAGTGLGVLHATASTNQLFISNPSSSAAAKAYAGMYLKDLIAVEAATYTSIIGGTPGLLPSALSVSLVGYLPFNYSISPSLYQLGNLSVLGKIGLSIPNFGSNNTIFQIRTVSPVWGIGAEYSLSSHFATRIEFEKFTRLGQINPVFYAVVGQVNKNLDATLTTASLKYRF